VSGRQDPDRLSGSSSTPAGAELRRTLGTGAARNPILARPGRRHFLAPWGSRQNVGGAGSSGPLQGRPAPPRHVRARGHARGAGRGPRGSPRHRWRVSQSLFLLGRGSRPMWPCYLTFPTRSNEPPSGHEGLTAGRSPCARPRPRRPGRSAPGSCVVLVAAQDLEGQAQRAGATHRRESGGQDTPGESSARTVPRTRWRSAPGRASG
jgi:hypothetical protein